MAVKYQLSLFVFRRDLRIHDNTGLNQALVLSKSVIPCFIFDPRQCDAHPYRSEFALNFLIESIEDLQAQFKAKGKTLYLFYGKSEDIIKALLQELVIDAVMVNRDYTPFSTSRDLAIKKNVEELGKSFYNYGDALLHEPNEVSKPDGSGPYTVFTPFYKRSQTIPVRPVVPLTHTHFYDKPIKSAITTFPDSVRSSHALSSPIKGGRAQALAILKKLNSFKEYEHERNIPSLDKTTHLSAHHKFGTVSIREVYHALAKQLGLQHALIGEIYWRDFFTHIAYHFPYVFAGAFHGEYDNLAWSTDEEAFQRWCEGKTGFPIVDAGMRELNATGFMHNRVRMITGSFLVKDLHIDWHRGEQYFASRLVDYDPCVNNGNWQWVASTGCDRQPYFRIFNPWLQQAKFDPQAIYIKRWVPELKDVHVSDIHHWDHNPAQLIPTDYPKPMLDHATAKAKVLVMFKNCKPQPTI